jgi:mannose-6-phosphate isomerase-like protein (cupin superfamily)
MKEVKRPWGDFKRFVLNKKCTVKVLTIKPRQELSLQYHNHREEMVYFFDKAVVQLGKRKIKVKKGTTIIIKKREPHRVIALNNTVRYLEVSLGDFNEKDEVRLEDKYGRA